MLSVAKTLISILSLWTHCWCLVQVLQVRVRDCKLCMPARGVLQVSHACMLQCLYVCWVCVNSVRTSISFSPEGPVCHTINRPGYVLQRRCLVSGFMLRPVTLGHVFVAMVTASGVTVNETSEPDGCAEHFSLCVCIKWGTFTTFTFPGGGGLTNFRGHSATL